MRKPVKYITSLLFERTNIKLSFEHELLVFRVSQLAAVSCHSIKSSLEFLLNKKNLVDLGQLALWW